MSMQFRGSLIHHCSFSALILCAALVSGCGAAADSPGTVDEGGATSSAGSSGSVGVAGSAAAGGASTFGGAAGSTGGQELGGSPQTAGAAGQSGGSAGAFAGGAGGAAAGGGGTSGHGGQSTGGSGGSGGGAAPTWTQLYTQFFDNPQYASNCTGSKCHNPGTQKSISFSTQAKGYASVKATLSKVTSVLSGGSMPQGRPKMPAADLAMFKAWVAAGALNN